MIPLGHYLIVSAILFAIGTAGVVSYLRRTPGILALMLAPAVLTAALLLGAPDKPNGQYLPCAQYVAHPCVPVVHTAIAEEAGDIAGLGTFAGRCGLLGTSPIPPPSPPSNN